MTTQHIEQIYYLLDAQISQGVDTLFLTVDDFMALRAYHEKAFGVDVSVDGTVTYRDLSVRAASRSRSVAPMTTQPPGALRLVAPTEFEMEAARNGKVKVVTSKAVPLMTDQVDLKVLEYTTHIHDVVFAQGPLPGENQTFFVFLSDDPGRPSVY